VVGGLAGLGIGSLIGAGTGRDVAMVGGALAAHWARIIASLIAEQ